MAREDSPYRNRFTKRVFYGNFEDDAKHRLNIINLPPFADIPDLEIDTAHFVRWNQNRWRRPRI